MDGGKKEFCMITEFKTSSEGEELAIVKTLQHQWEEWNWMIDCKQKIKCLTAMRVRFNSLVIDAN